MAYNRSNVARAIDPQSRPRYGRARSSPIGANDEDLTLLLREVNHRVRNLLAMMEVVVDETHPTSIEEYRAGVMTRIAGIGEFFETMCRADCRNVGLARVFAQMVLPDHAETGRIRSNGPNVDVSRRLALMLHLVFHELATNAIKYGALSAPAGSVDVRWNVRETSAGRRTLAIIWTEQGGPEVTVPRRRGFGSRLITRALREYGNVCLDFDKTGVACYMLIDLDCGDGALD
jgi:two-component sensor histidine kinase